MTQNLRTFTLWSCLLGGSLVYGQKLREQQAAPLFVAKDAKDQTITLEQYKGKKVFLSFFRYAGCPVCNMRMHELIAKHDSLISKGYQVIAVFETKANILQSYLNDKPLDFPVISDPQRKLYKLYGVKKSIRKMMRTMFNKKGASAARQGKALFKGKTYKRDGSLSRIPADFVIDENGTILIVHYGKYIADHLPLETILK